MTPYSSRFLFVIVVLIVGRALGLHAQTNSERLLFSGIPLSKIEPSNSCISGVAIADFNRDGNLDLAVGFIDYFHHGNDPKICIRLGDGKGAFPKLLTQKVAGVSYSRWGVYNISSLNFDGDANVDIAIRGNHTSCLLRGKGDGTFTLRALADDFNFGYPAGCIADLNNNGLDDFLITRAGEFRCFLDGATNATPVQVNEPFYDTFPYWVDALHPGDFNEDGSVEILADSGSFHYLVSSTNNLVFQNVGSIYYQPRHRFFGESQIADVNMDSHLDLIVMQDPDAANDEPPGVKGKITTLLGNGDGTFKTPIFSDTGSEPICSTVIDFDGDGNLDVVIGNYQKTLTFMKGLGDGRFVKVLHVGINFVPVRLKNADFNKDGKVDFFVSGWTGGPLSNEDHPGYSAIILNRAGYKLNKSDVVWQNGSGALACWIMDSTNYGGSLGLQTALSMKSWRASSLHDLDQDGKPDLLVQNLVDGRIGFASVEGMSVGSIKASPKPAALPLAARQLTAADYNGDGHKDIIWFDGNSVFVTTLIGTNVFQTKSVSSSAGGGTTAWLGWKLVGTANFNGDARTEFLWQDTDRTLWISDEWGPFAANRIRVNQLPFSAGWSILALADYNGDGANDIWFQHTSGRVAVWLLKGTNRIGVASVRAGQPVVAAGWRMVGVR